MRIKPFPSVFRRIFSLVAAAICAGAFSVSQAGGLFGNNLIVNGDAEGGPGSVSGNDLYVVPGWSTNGSGFTVVQYGVSSDVATNCPGPANRGVNFFAGGPNNAISSAYQDIDVSPGTADIDNGMITAELTGYLGGWTSQDDRAMLSAAFLDGTGGTLGQLSIGPVLASDRTNATALLFRGATNSLPSGTRKVRVTLTMTRASGSYNDGYADNLSLVLRHVPFLSVTQTGTQAMISWPGDALGYQLESTVALGTAASWAAVGGAPQLIGNSWTVNYAMDTPQRFFRLHKP